MVAGSGTVPLVAYNNEEGTQSIPPTNGGTNPAPVISLHHMVSAALSSHYTFQTKTVCEHHKNSISNTEFSSFISDL